MVKEDVLHYASAKYQYFARDMNLLTIGYGCTCGWTSPSIILLTSDETPLVSGKITMDEASWLAFLICVGGILGNIFFGFITNRFGRKLLLILISIPTNVNWLIIFFASNVYQLYVARIIGGFVGGGVFVIIPLFLSEIACDQAGRKFLFLVSTFGTALGLITLRVYMMLKTWKYNVEELNWIPIASFSFVIFVASCAILTLPFLVISEIIPENLKEFGVSFCMTLLWSFAFIILKYLPLLTGTLGFHGSMFLFAGACLSGAIFIMFYMPETKGKS
ncbi:facilitated trehalose transporter Tret1-like [Contarinia nasturtii]|uniref:facilitated trehalose transporter Tret1-like n=1 Tax=Contarinia nasturtii TaxID=265458 RepID=UPI0012D45E71|nr:facilitated trehalose transporter Tret1-like [Contarinia nasturtii]